MSIITRAAIARPPQPQAWEITELELNPVIAGADGAAAAYAQIRVAPQVPRDPFLRRLRLPAAGRAARVLGPPPSTLTTLFTCRPDT